MQHLKACWITEEVLFEMRGGGDEVNARRIQQVCRRMWPWRRLVRSAGHDENLKEGFDGDKGFVESDGHDESGAEGTAVRGRWRVKVDRQSWRL